MTAARAHMLAILNLATLVACASSAPQQLGTGDVSFRLLWSGESDLDIHVSDPQGEQISHRHRRSSTGGVLDVDCNADRICVDPVENVYWPLGQAPSGRYRVWVRVHRLQEGESPVEVRLLILRGGAIVEQHRGVLISRWAVLGPYEYNYSGGPDSADLLEPSGSRWVSRFN